MWPAIFLHGTQVAGRTRGQPEFPRDPPRQHYRLKGIEQHQPMMTKPKIIAGTLV